MVDGHLCSSRLAMGVGVEGRICSPGDGTDRTAVKVTEGRLVKPDGV